MCMAVSADNGACYTFEVFQYVVNKGCQVGEGKGWTVQEMLCIAREWC